MEENTPNTIGNLLKYLDERMCHPDRKYWMVGRKGERRGVGFVQGVAGLVIPDLAIVHAEIVNMVGENTYDGWREGTRVSSSKGELLATAHVNEDGSISWDVAEAGKKWE